MNRCAHSVLAARASSCQLLSGTFLVTIDGGFWQSSVILCCLLPSLPALAPGLCPAPVTSDASGSVLPAQPALLEIGITVGKAPGRAFTRTQVSVCEEAVHRLLYRGDRPVTGMKESWAHAGAVSGGKGLSLTSLRVATEGWGHPCKCLPEP